MNNHHEVVSRKLEDLKQKIKRLINDALHCQWSHGKYLEHLKEEILNSNSYKTIPRWAVENLHGFREALKEELLWKNVIFSYIIKHDEDNKNNGVRASIKSKEYKDVLPIKINELYSQTGCYIYKDSPHRFFTQPNDDSIKTVTTITTVT